MTIEIRFRTYALLTLALLVSTLVLSGTALAMDSSSDILENISYNKNSLRFAKIVDDFETTTANPEAFLKDVADGKVKLKLLGKEFDLELENTHVVSDDAKVLIENETGTYTIPATKINTYRGKVIGEENSSAGFAVSNEALIGHIKVGNIYYAIELTNKTVDGKSILAVYSSDAVKVDKNSKIAFCGVEEQPSLEDLPNIKETNAHTILATTYVDLLPAYDQDFKNLYGSDSASQLEISNRINDAKSAYSPASVEFSITNYKKYGSLSSGTGVQILDFFKSDIPSYRDITNSDLAILFYGKDLTDNVIGRSTTYTGSSDQAYSIVQMVENPGTTYHATADGKSTLIAHELGHNFAATHNEAYSWTESGTQVYSAMNATWMGDSLMKRRFSSNDGIHGDSTHNNIQHVQSTKSTVAGFR
jgi:Reprolysin family propeptide.